jgi:hypothetical protein
MKAKSIKGISPEEIWCRCIINWNIELQQNWWKRIKKIRLAAAKKTIEQLEKNNL